MSMDVGGAKGGLKADINVTPLVDVMLVLLIIMMLVAPMLQKGVDVRLPQASNVVGQARDPGADGHRHRGRPAPVPELGARSARTTCARRSPRCSRRRRRRSSSSRRDIDAPYSAVMATMDKLREAQIENVGLITEKKIRAGGSGGGQ